jgi:hypothetical protein
MGTEPLFELGRTVATPAALVALEEAGESALTYLTRHHHGDYGDLTYGDIRANESADKHGDRILSAYHLKTGQKIYVITDAVGNGQHLRHAPVRLPTPARTAPP